MFSTPVGCINPEHTVALNDLEVQLHGLIVLHSTTPRSACGDTWFWQYPDITAVLRDAERLAEAMSYKNALADLPVGGDKIVAMIPEGQLDRAKLFRVLGEALKDSMAAMSPRWTSKRPEGTW